MFVRDIFVASKSFNRSIEGAALRMPGTGRQPASPVIINLVYCTLADGSLLLSCIQYISEGGEWTDR